MVDGQGRMMNVYRHTLDDAMGKKEVRLFRNSTMAGLCYRYFVTSLKQLRTFQLEREYGTAEGPNKAFHVYVDEDIDKNSEQYKTYFIKAREL